MRSRPAELGIRERTSSAIFCNSFEKLPSKTCALMNLNKSHLLSNKLSK